MTRMKDENFVCFLLFLLFLDFSSCIYISSESATKSTNETFIVNCKDQGGAVVRWIGPSGRDLGVKTRPRVHQASYGTSIIFNGTMVDDTGIYTCSSPSGTKQFHLIVEAPLVFMDTPMEQNGKEGDDITLRCEVRGGQVSWFAEGQDLEEPKYKIIDDGLVVKKLNRNDSRTYTCKAVQQATGAVQDRKIKLTVQHKPSLPYPVYAKYEQAYGYMDGLVNLTCEVEADPPPKFEWRNMERQKPLGRVVNVSSHISVLQLIMRKSTMGRYKCTASNALGKLEREFNLEEGTKPPAPTFIELRGENSDLLDLGIHGATSTIEEIEHGMQPKWYQVEYRPMSARDWDSKRFEITEENSYPLRGLQHDTEYEVRAASLNVAGLSDFTNSSFFKTLTSSTDGVHIALPTLYNKPCYLSGADINGLHIFHWWFYLNIFYYYFVFI